MNKNSVVQISSKEKSLNGCIGILLSVENFEAKVNIYYPKDEDKNAFVKTVTIPLINLTYIGEPKLKPL